MIDHISIVVGDIHATEAFYTALLGPF